MKLSRNCKPGLKGILRLACCLSLLLMIFIPSTVLALPIVSSTGSIMLDALALGFDIPGNVSFLDGDLADTRSSFSGAWVGLNGVETDPGGSDFFEGAFSTTSFSAFLSDASGQVTGSGATTATSTSASSGIGLNSGPSLADVFIAQAALTGQFTVSAPTQLTVSATYSYNQSLSSVDGGSAFSDILAGIYLFDFLTSAQLDQREFSLVNSIVGAGAFSSSDGGILRFVYDLASGIVYDFEASASTVASAKAPASVPAPVPEPATMLLLGTGLLGVGVLSRKANKA